jgi:hypothetical protein
MLTALKYCDHSVRLNTEVVSSSPIRGIDACIYFVFVFYYV